MANTERQLSWLDRLKGRIVIALVRIYSRLGWSRGHAVDLLFFRRLEWRAIRQFLRPHKGCLVLDVACGGGLWAGRLTETGATVVGLDIDPQSIKIAAASRRRGDNTHFVCADAQAMPFRTGSFDQAFSICALEHFEDDQDALRELHRVLKAGGSAAITVDSLSYPGALSRGELAMHMQRHAILRRYMLPDLTDKVVASGFCVEDSRYLVNSPLSSFFFRKHALWNLMEHENRIALLFPLVYPAALVSDIISARRDVGQILAVKIRRR